MEIKQIQGKVTIPEAKDLLKKVSSALITFEEVDKIDHIDLSIFKTQLTSIERLTDVLKQYSVQIEKDLDKRDDHAQIL